MLCQICRDQFSAFFVGNLISCKCSVGQLKFCRLDKTGKSSRSSCCGSGNIHSYQITKLGSFQCDQIWRIFPTLAQCSKTLAILKVLIQYFEHFKLTLGKFKCLWAIFECCKCPNIKHILQQSGHTGLVLYQPTLL